MINKKFLRKKFYKIRKKKYFEISPSFFKPLDNIIRKFSKSKKIYLSLYYPSNYEVNTLKIFEKILSKNYTSLLPCISSKNMKFYKWNYKDTLIVNQYGMLEPSKTRDYFIPNLMLVPLLAFDKENYRLGYGKGYYDTFLNRYLKKNINILTIGIAFSFQKYNKIPTARHDVKLDYVLTEKGLQ